VTTLRYDDGEVETLDLNTEKFKIINSAPQSNLNGESSVSDNDGSSNVKKRKIIEESEDEYEFDEKSDDGESDVSEYNAGNVSEEYEEDDDLSLIVTDEDDEGRIPLKKKENKEGKKRLCVTRVENLEEGNFACNTKGDNDEGDTDVASYITPPPKPKAPAKSGNSNNTFGNFVCASKEITHPKSDSNMKDNNKITPSPHYSPSSNSNKVGDSSPLLPKVLPEAKVLNAVGTHTHNHFKFLTVNCRRDLKNRLADHPNYNPRTIRVDYDEMERVSGNITPASRQWWEIKAEYADTLLLFKTGKFYEIFHMDADIAVKVLGFTYMKGKDAHAGFPEPGYGVFCEKLVAAGHKVARVEQTETPDSLKERKKKTRTGKKPQVVNREVCSIMSAGTRTFCYMDKYVESESDYGSTTGPLLAIKETLITMDSANPPNESDNVKPVCEYGVALIDAPRGMVTLGQFADDVLRSRINTLLTTFHPVEVLVEGGENGVSPTLLSLLKCAQTTNLPNLRIEKVLSSEQFPKSTALDVEIREKIERPNLTIQPWDVEETIDELHRRNYFPRSSRKGNPSVKGDLKNGISRWPDVLKACIEGKANFALSAFGAALFYLQRGLIDEEILSMGIVKAYCPPEPSKICTLELDDKIHHAVPSDELQKISADEERIKAGIDFNNTTIETNSESCTQSLNITNRDSIETFDMENHIDHMSLDGTTLANLEILSNSHSNTSAGSLWSKINHTKTPHGNRLLRAWLLRPLFRKADIDRRADAVEELTTGDAFDAMDEARRSLCKCGDMERLLSRVHSMSSNSNTSHPNERAVLYETATHTKRKVGDFSKLLKGLTYAAKIPDIFCQLNIKSGLLKKIVNTKENEGCFPSGLNDELDWYFDNFDCDMAAKGMFEPTRGIDDDYDSACDLVSEIKEDLDDYKNKMSTMMYPKHIAKTQWKYANTKDDSKDKYLIELPVSVEVPNDFFVKGKRGSGKKQVNKYRTPFVEQLVHKLEQAISVVKAGKARGMQLVFAKFDSMRPCWASAVQATAMLDALAALAETSCGPGFSRAIIKDCTANTTPTIHIVQGRHPCVDSTHSGDDFIPNNVSLGGNESDGNSARVLLLSGPNMGGKSTLLRQTCLLTILGQIGCFVPAEECSFTPVDRIFTRLGASDHILMGQSTFFVELAETAAALRGANRRSLVIMDELGRGTATFDGTAIASATVQHLAEKNQCLTMFATHYHSLLEDWKDEPSVRLGHMECLVEKIDDVQNEENITFLYTLGAGSCPKSFGINVARLAALPEEVLIKAKRVSSLFEASMSEEKSLTFNAASLKLKLKAAYREENWEECIKHWSDLQTKIV